MVNLSQSVIISKDPVQCRSSVGPFECDILNGNHFRLRKVLETVVYFLLPVLNNSDIKSIKSLYY